MVHSTELNAPFASLGRLMGKRIAREVKDAIKLKRLQDIVA